MSEFNEKEFHKELQAGLSSAGEASKTIFASIYENVNEFIKGKDLLELVKLALYIKGSDAIDRPPTEIEREFISEFFTDEKWAEHIQNLKRERVKYFNASPIPQLDDITGILYFEVCKLMENHLGREHLNLKLILAKQKVKDTTLKYDLGLAIHSSYEDGIFYKDKGWCNVADVLVNHKLITLTED